MNALHDMRFGAQVLDSGGVRFALWAPGCAQVAVVRVGSDGRLMDRCEMQRDAEGWHDCVWLEAGPGTRYRFDLGQGVLAPDPASRCNPDGVHEASEVVDPRAHVWADGGWTGLPWHSATLYELHVGCFTPKGTLDAAAGRLPYLRELGIRALQLMPLAAFAGRRGWGYDGVLPFAVHPAYGGPLQLKQFVDTAHRLGMMVLLDVVYNHFGPDGNYLHDVCPQFYDPRRSTPWGPGFRFEGEAASTVRRFFIDNALFWVTEFHIDGLRLDAVHAMHDGSPRHLVEDIAAALRDGPGRQRHVHLVLENDANTARWLQRDDTGRARVAQAQWNDDWHHAAHVLATGEDQGYYQDYQGDQGDQGDQGTPLALFGRALAEGFVYQGQPSPHRGGRARGEPSAALPPLAFVNFLQNHDQVGNRACGERLDALARTERIETLLGCLLLAPQVPMLFMGEEFAASTPFLYFCDFDGELADAVRRGRRQEFAHWADASGERIPDPNAEATFLASRLRWAELDSDAGRRRLALVSQLLRLRRLHLQPHLPALRHGGTLQCGGVALRVEWPLAAGRRWTMRARFGGTPEAWPLQPDETEIYRAGGPAEQILVTLVALRGRAMP